MSASLQDYADSPATTAPSGVLFGAPTASKEHGRKTRRGKTATIDATPVIRGLYEIAQPFAAPGELSPAAEERTVVAVSFSGRLAIPGIRGYPEEQWTARFSNQKAVFQNEPHKPWPKVDIEFDLDEPIVDHGIESFLAVLPRLGSAKLDARPSGDTAEAEVLYTAVILSAEAAQTTSLQSADGFTLFSLRHERMTKHAREQLEFRAALYRKIRCLESEFSTEFRLPNYVPPEDVRLVETLYDGVVNGVATTRGSDMTLPGIRGRDFDLGGPPFTGPGKFKRNVSWDGKWFGLFGQRLDVGKVVLTLDAAEAADPRVVDQMGREPDQPVNLRLVVYDHQIKHRFEKYLRRPMKKRLAVLKSFRRRLAAHEPSEISDLVSRPLVNDVLADKAVQIAKGWLYLNRFTERYCPQDPQLDPSGQTWIVPIHLVYTNGGGGLVGELGVDVKTGRVTSHSEPEEMQSRAEALAKQIFHA